MPAIDGRRAAKIRVEIEAERLARLEAGLVDDVAWRAERQAKWERRVRWLCLPRTIGLGVGLAVIYCAAIVLVLAFPVMLFDFGLGFLLLLGGPAVAALILCPLGVLGLIVNTLIEKVHTHYQRLAKSECVDLDPLPPWP